MGKKILMFLACAVMSAGMAFAQQQVTGTVVDSETGEPLVGATVKVKGTTKGALTDMDGKFTLKNIPAKGGTLVISCMGMKSVEVQAKGKMQISMEPVSTDLQDVMVVAYGTQKKSTFTGSASVVNAETIENRQISNVSNALAGNVAGVTAFQSTGQPGSGSTIYIRGYGSINAGKAPLYVLDGMAYEGDISAINPDDVESVSVLKDAAAAALYGARGANGVIMITTKKGKKGQDAKITLSASWGGSAREVGNYDVITSTNQYMEQLYRSRYNNAIYTQGMGAADARAYASAKAASATGIPIYTVAPGESLFDANGRINPNARLGYSDGEYTYTPDDWTKESLTHGFRQEYNLGVNGGTDKISYYLNLGYLGDEGIIKKSSFDRISTRLSVDYQAKKWLKFTTNLSYVNSSSNYPELQDNTDGNDNTTSSGNVFYIINHVAPVYPMYVRDAQGNIKYDGKNPIYDYGDLTTSNYTRNWMSMSNPIGDLTYKTEEYLMDIFNSRWGIELTPVKGLTLTGKIGMDLDNTRNHMATSSKYGQSASNGGEASQLQIRQLGVTQQYMGNYRTRFLDDHSIDILAGYESYDWQYEYVSAYGRNLYQSGLWAVNNAIDGRRGYGLAHSRATRSVLGRVNYDFDEKYFVSGSLRTDGSSRFAKGNRWGTFWSASAAWEMAKEDFLDDAEWIDLLKVRASFGQQGNDNIGNNYAYVDQYKMTGNNGTFSDGSLSYKANPELTWEKSNAYDVAVDFEFFKKRLSGSLDFYNRTTKDMLYYKPVAPSNGYTSIPMNIGSMRNRGVELDLHGVVFDTKNFKWGIDFNMAYNNNKILELAPELDGQLIDGSSIYHEGHSMYEYYLVKYAGVDKTNGLALYWAKDNNGNEYATSSYATARTTNRQATGDLQANWFGGVGTKLEFFGFDLGLQCSYQFGGKLYDMTYQDLMNNLSSTDAGSNIHKDMLKAWTPENTNTDIPRLCADDQYTNATSDRWLVSSNYFSINNVTLGYTIPKDLLRKIKVDNIRIYCSGDNLALFSARKGLDPRLGIRSATNSIYAALRSVSGGVKVTF